ncbi:Mammalian Ependymin-Related Protein 1 [Manis pentadactyla]|nr:Mammalian Ependymin-Related Protein 1 [Manis pentadactyla]
MPLTAGELELQLLLGAPNWSALLALTCFPAINTKISVLTKRKAIIPLRRFEKKLGHQEKVGILDRRLSLCCCPVGMDGMEKVYIYFTGFNSYANAAGS